MTQTGARRHQNDVRKLTKMCFEKHVKKNVRKERPLVSPNGLCPPPPPEMSEGSARLEAFLKGIPFILALVANQSAAAFGPRLQFQAFPTACAYMLILLRGVYICIYI